MRGYDDGGQVVAPAYTAPPDWGAPQQALQQPTTNQADEAFLKSPEAVPPSQRTPPAVPGPVGGQGLEYGAGNTGTTVIANAPPQSAAKGTTLPDDVASTASKGTTIPDDLAASDPKASLEDTLKEFPTSTDLDHAAASGVITRQQAQDAKAELIKQYSSASSDQQKAMRKQEDDAAKAENKQTTLPGDVAQPVSQQGQVNPVVKFLGDVSNATGLTGFSQQTSQAIDNLLEASGSTSFDGAKDFLKQLNGLTDAKGNKLLSDDDYAAKLAKVEEAEKLFQQSEPIWNWGKAGDLQKQVRQLMTEAVPAYMKYGHEKALAEAQKGGEGFVKDVESLPQTLFKATVPGQIISSIQTGITAATQGTKAAIAQETNPTGHGVNFFDQTQGQRDAHMDQRFKDYQDALDQINIPEAYYHGAPKAELEAAHMAADPERAQAVRAFADNGALLLASMGIAPVTAPFEEAAAGAATKVISTVVGKPMARLGETIMGPAGPKVPLLKQAGTAVKRTLKGAAWNMLNPSYRDAWGKALQGDPSDLLQHHLGELALDVSVPNIIGKVRKLGIVPKFLGDVITTLDAGATRDLVRGEAVPSNIPYRSAIKGNIYRGLVGIPASAGESFITGAARTVLPSLIANNPQISEGDWSGFWHDTLTGGGINAFLHAPYDLQRVLRNTVFDPFVLPKGGTAKPSWGPNFYNDALTPSRAEAYNKLDPDRQNQWLHFQGWAQRNGVEAHGLPTETVGDVAQNVYGSATRPRGFSVPGDPSTTPPTPPKIFVGLDDFNPTGGHELGHATLDGMHPEDQKRFIYAASQVRNLDDIVNNYAHMVDPTLGKQVVKFSDLPTANEANPTHPEYNQAKVDLGKRAGLPTQDHALKEVTADTMGKFMTGGRASDYTKNPSLRRQLMMGIAAGMERWGFPTTTADVDGPIGVRNGAVMGRLFDKYMTKWRQGGYTFGSPAGEIKLPGKMEQAYQQAEAAKNAPLPAPTTPPAHADIANRAYDIGQERMRTGRPGDATSDWLQAEFQLSHPEGRPPPQGPAPSIWEPLGKAAKGVAPYYNKLPAVAALHPPRTLAAPPAAPGIPPAPAVAQQQPAQPPAQQQQPAPTTTKPLKPELAHHLQAELKKHGASPGQAQAIAEDRTTTAQPQKTQTGIQIGETKPGKVHGVVGSEFGEVDNPRRGGYTEPGWNKGAWGDDLSGENNEGVALPTSILRHVGYTGQKGYGQYFNSHYAVRIYNPKTGATTTTSLKDLGPGKSTGALIDMLWGTRKALGFEPNFKGGVNFEIIDKDTGKVAYQPTGSEIDEGGGGAIAGRGKGGGGDGGGGGGFGTYPPEVQQQLQEYAQELASRGEAPQVGGTYKPAPEIQAPARRGGEGGGGGGGGAAPAVQEIDQTPLMMGMGYGPMALGLPPGAMGMPPAAPAEMPRAAGAGALSFMPMPLGRGRKLGSLETEGGEEEEPSTIGNGAAANEVVAPHLAKGTMDSLKDALKAHASALSDDDPRVHKGADNMFKGEYFQPGDALHEHVLSNVPENEQHVLRAATDAIANRSLMHVTYASAPRQGLGEETPTTKTRQIEYEMSTPQARMLKQTSAQLAGHTMVPTSIGVKLAGKKGEPHEGYVQGLSMNAAAGNHYHINKALAEAGEETPYPDVNQKFINDIEGYVSNLNAGHRGTGEGHQPSSEEYPVDVDPTHVPYRLHPREAQFLNAVINNQAARAKSAVGLRELARKGGTLLNEEGETNPIRHAIDEREAVKRQELARANPDNPILQERANKRWSQDTLEPVIRTFKAGLVHEVHPSHEEMPEAIRPGEAFKPLGEAMQRQMPYGRPDVPMSLSFLPGAGGQERERINKPAVKYRNKIYEGDVHEDAGRKAFAEQMGGTKGIAKLESDPQFAERVERRLQGIEEDQEPWISGFTTTHGRFVDRDEGLKLARDAGQLRRTGASELHSMNLVDPNWPNEPPPVSMLPGGKKTPEPLSPEEHEELTGNIRKQFLSGKLRTGDYLERLREVPEPGEQIAPPEESLRREQATTQARYPIPGNLSFLPGKEDPLTLHHGTGERFEAFDPNRSASGTMWFTSEPRAARIYAKRRAGEIEEMRAAGDLEPGPPAEPQVHQYNVSLKNPLDASQPMTKQFFDRYTREWNKDRKERGVPELTKDWLKSHWKSVQSTVQGNQAKDYDDSIMHARGAISLSQPKQFKKILQRMGHDGIKYYGPDPIRDPYSGEAHREPYDQYGAFNPEQIEKTGETPGIAFLPPKASEADKVKLEKPKNWDQQPEHVRQAYLEQKVAQTLARQHTGPETHPLEVLRNAQGGIKYDPNGKPIYKKHDYDIVNAPLLGDKRLSQIATEKANEHEDIVPDNEHQYLKPIERRRLSAMRNASAVSTMGDKIVQSYLNVKDIPDIAKGSGWYSRMRKKLKQYLGEHHELFAQLLGATSAKTPVRNNFIQALDALEQFRSGAFDRHRAKYLEAYHILKEGGPEALVAHMQKLGIPLYEVDTKGNRTYLRDDQTHKTAAAAMANWIDHHDIIPKQKIQPGALTGSKYNANSMAVLRALAGTWLEETKAPKTPNFAGNLTGRSLEATIDVWAARHIQRLGYEGLTGDQPWRAQSAAEPGVSALDFAFSQDAMRDAANKLTKMGIKMKPDDLQAILWFAEKHHYEGKKWTRGAGAAKSSFDDVADLAFPKTGEPMTSDDLRTHFGKIQKEAATRNARIKKAKEYVGHADPKMAAKLEPYMKQHGLTEEEVYGAEPEEEEEDNLSSWEK